MERAEGVEKNAVVEVVVVAIQTGVVVAIQTEVARRDQGEGLLQVPSWLRPVAVMSL
jgi:hypothetical protein